MNRDAISPGEVVRRAAREGLPLDPERAAVVAATASHIHRVVSTLRDLELGDTAPAACFEVGPQRSVRSAGGSA